MLFMWADDIFFLIKWNKNVLSIYNDSSTFTFVRLWLDQVIIRPVSYTHLDVYKRQELSIMKNDPIVIKFF